MLGGLFRLHRHGHDTVGLTKLLWKQVGWRFLLAMVLQFIDMFCFRKGVIWLLLATVAEVPPGVSLASPLRLSIPLTSILRARCL